MSWRSRTQRIASCKGTVRKTNSIPYGVFYSYFLGIRPAFEFARGGRREVDEETDEEIVGMTDLLLHFVN